MRQLLRNTAALSCALLLAFPAIAQVLNPVTPLVAGAAVASGNPMPVSGTFSASLSGFSPASVGTPISVTTGGVTGTLPAGTVVVASNVGATNTAYCALGGSATTAWQPISPNGGWFAFTVGAATQLTCITSTSTTTVNMVGGSGLPTGTGGGGGCSSGGNVNLSQVGGSNITIGQALAAASLPVILPAATITTLTPPAAITNFANETGGNLAAIKADTDKIPSQGQALAAASTPVVLTAAQITTLTPPAAITNFALETGGNLATVAGAVTSSVEQANEKQINGVVPLMNNGVSGTGSQRVNIASDNTAFQVKALGNAGAVMDFAGQNAAAPANSLQMGCQFQTSPTTITAGNASPCQLDNAGNLLVNIKAGASSGAVAQGSTTSGQTGGLTQAAVTTSAPSYTTAQTSPLSLDTAGNLRVNVTTATGIAQGSTTSGQTGSLVMGAASTNAPTATTADTWPLSISPASGGVRIDLKDTAANTNPLLVTPSAPADPCFASAKKNVPIATSSGNVQLVAPSGSTKVYICSFKVVAAAAAVINVIEGTGGACTTSAEAAIWGSTTAASGESLAANGGETYGAGIGSVGQTATAGNGVCLLQSGTTALAGNLTYVQQ